MAMGMGMGPDIRELSFQNVIDSILKPAGVKVGGYPDEMFVDMDEDDKEKWTCNICYLIVREARQCDNKHLFCRTCCFAWTLTYSENSQKCPMCRSEQKEYQLVDGVDTEVGKHRVICPDENCDFRAPLSIFLQHSHGMKKFRNETSDLESLRPNRPPGAQLLVFPSASGNNPVERALSLREQLTQGRMMLHQMMLLLQLEMHLRRQAAISVMQDRGSRQIDEALALNEQLSEVGGVLHALMNVPIRSTESSAGNPTARFILAAIGDDDNTSESSESSDSTVISRHRSQYIIRGNRNRLNETSSNEDNPRSRPQMTIRLSPRTPTLPSPFTNGLSVSADTGPSVQTHHSPRQSLLSTNESESSEPERPLRRSDIRSQLYSNTGQAGSSSQSAVPPTTPRILQRATQNNVSLATHSSSVSQAAPQSGNSDGPSSTSHTNLHTPSRPSQQIRNSQERERVTNRNRDRNDSIQSNTTSLPPINTGQLSTTTQITNSNTPVPPGSSTHQLTMREFATERPSNSNSVTDAPTTRAADDEAIITIQGSGPSQRNNRFRRESSTRPDPVPEQSQGIQPQTRQSTVNFQEPLSSQQEPSVSETSHRHAPVGRGSQTRNSRTSGSQEPARTSGSYSPQKRFRRDSSNRPILRQVQPTNSGQTSSTNGTRSSRPSQSNQGNASENQSDTSLPTTAGSLMRARRRSEIQRQIHDSFNDS